MRTIRRLAERDLGDAARIDRSAFASHANETESLHNLREELARPWAYLTVATNDPEDDVVGFLVAWFVADEAHLLNVAVDESCRRQGVGRSLVENLLQTATARGVQKVFLEVRTKNAAAVAMYEALGFETLSVRKRYYPDGEDAFDMALVLTK